MPPHDRSLNCSLNLKELEGGREELWPNSANSFLEVWMERGTLGVNRDSDYLHRESAISYYAEKKAICEDQKIIFIFILETYG